MNKCDVRLRVGSWTAGSIIENFRVKKNCNSIEGERRAVAGVQKAAALSLPSRVEQWPLSAVGRRRPSLW